MIKRDIRGLSMYEELMAVYEKKEGSPWSSSRGSGTGTTSIITREPYPRDIMACTSTRSTGTSASPEGGLGAQEDRLRTLGLLRPEHRGRDIHDVGKNIFTTLMGTAGFEVIDLGVDVSAETIVAAVREHSPNILGLSALLTTNLEQFPLIVEMLVYRLTL